jgi:DNA (cytosine-5)-methyltransferase 1
MSRPSRIEFPEALHHVTSPQPEERKCDVENLGHPSGSRESVSSTLDSVGELTRKQTSLSTEWNSGKSCYHQLELLSVLPSMTDQLLIRKVPSDLRLWIERERQQHGMSQQEFVLRVLEQAHETRDLPLFSIPKPTAAPAPDRMPFKFIDLFAGVGGFRTALDRIGGQCVFSCEWDRYSQKTYKAWYGDTPHGDIRNVAPADIPDHDILTAGFPCQPFSIAGVSKKLSLGHAHGFKDERQGNLFFYLATIIQQKRPPVAFLENVKNLKSHDQGRTWATIKSTLEDLDYKVFDKVIDAAGWVPQHRERVYIVCFDRNVFGDNPPFEYPAPPSGPKPKLADILDPNPDAKYTLSDHLWNYLQEYAQRHKEKGNGFGFGLIDPAGVSRTLSARYFKDGSEILIPQNGKPPRRLTPLECARLMGFDETKKIPVSDTQAYRQFGNAVVPPVAEAVAREILKVLTWQLMRTGCLLKKKPKVRRN